MTPIVLGADHAGYRLKERIAEHLKAKGFEVIDVGCFSEESVDYPDIAGKLAGELQRLGPEARGVLCCGSGIGVCMTANRFPWVRAAVVHEHNTAVMSRKHNNANVACFGGRVIAPELAFDLLASWLETPFEGGRHQKRVELMGNIHVENQGNPEGSAVC